TGISIHPLFVRFFVITDAAKRENRTPHGVQRYGILPVSLHAGLTLLLTGGHEAQQGARVAVSDDQEAAVVQPDNALPVAPLTVGGHTKLDRGDIGNGDAL